jgi:uncharacterized protein YbdZ (MbtH family)
VVRATAEIRGMAASCFLRNSRAAASGALGQQVEVQVLSPSPPRRIYQPYPARGASTCNSTPLDPFQGQETRVRHPTYSQKIPTSISAKNKIRFSLWPVPSAAPAPWVCRPAGCSSCGMFVLQDVRPAGCSSCRMFVLQDVRPAGCSGSGCPCQRKIFQKPKISLRKKHLLSDGGWDRYGGP